MLSIEVVIYTYNEEKNIHDAITAAKLLTDKIIVIDSQSTDRTAQIAKTNGAVVYSTAHSTYVEPLRELGIQKSTSDWVFILDADERMTKNLAREIKHIIKDPSVTHYAISRKNIFGKTKWLKHGGWWPDKQIRLISKNSFKGWPKDIHSTPRIDGREGTLREPLIHFFHGDFKSMVEKTIVFENIESDLLLAGRTRSTAPFTFFRKFAGELYRRLIRHSGFLDGKIGIIESFYQAFSKTITYLFLYEKKKSSAL